MTKTYSSSPLAFQYRREFITCFVFALIAIYLVNCFTPLRLTNDTIRYLTIKESIEAQKVVVDYLPYGYVFFLLSLSKLHLLNSFIVPVIHLLYLLGGLWFVKKLFPALKFWHLAIIVLLHWTTLKFVITFLSEMQFVFFSMGTLYFFHEYQKRKNAWPLICTFLFLAASILTRTVGIVLIPAICGSFMFQSRTSIREIISRNKWLLPATLICIVVILLFQKTLRVTDYFSLFRQSDPVKMISINLQYHLIDLASIFLNFPSSKAVFGSMAIVNGLFLFAGLSFFIAMIYLIFQVRKKIPVIVTSYILMYILVILFWPFYEPRFWVPILPLIAAIVLEARLNLSRTVRSLLNAYFIFYLVMGVTAIGYYTYTSFNKRALAIKQDAAIWRKEYETYFFGRPLSDSTGNVNQRVVDLLKKYN